MAMRGYLDIMGCTDPIDVNGNGGKVCFQHPEAHILWQPSSSQSQFEPLWHLRVHVLNDHEGRGDCPSRTFAFKSRNSLVRAADKLVAALGDDFEIRKGGIDTPCTMGGRVNDGRTENINIEYDTSSTTIGWKEFLGELNAFENEWDHEVMGL